MKSEKSGSDVFLYNSDISWLQISITAYAIYPFSELNESKKIINSLKYL